MTAGRPIRRRRRLDTLLLLGAVVLTGLVALVTAAIGKPAERVDSLWANAVVRADGGLRVTETIDYDFADGDRHGIYRQIPGTRSGTATALNVSMDGRPVPVDIERKPDSAGYTIGDPDHTVTGRHRYRLAYTLPGVMAGDGLDWNAVGTGWDVPIAHAEAHITAPRALPHPRCVSGDQGSEDPCAEAGSPAPGRIDVSADGLAAGQAMTVYTDQGAPLASAAPAALPRPPAAFMSAPEGTEGASPVAIWAAATGTALVTALLATLVIRRAGRERVRTPQGTRRRDRQRLADESPPSPTPPEGLTPAQAGVLLAGRARRRHRTAALLHAAATGHLILRGQPKTPRLSRPDQAPDAPTDPMTARALDKIFAHGRTVRLGTYHENFAVGWRQLGRDLHEWHRSGGKGLWEPGGQGRWLASVIVGGLGAAVGLRLMCAAAWQQTDPGGAWAVPLVLGSALVGAGAALVLRSWELRRHTELGTHLWCGTEAFRRHLAERPAHRDPAEAEALAGWAMALGEADSWTAAASTTAAAPQQTSPLGSDRVLRYSSALTSVASTSASAPSSSSDGGSGGSFSGSGGGGGGGGAGGGSGGGAGGGW
ncbi:DUF2207 domain-containing protein [Streptomyces endophyticus]|uniref:DUF2207 domain-containing protein n=1 Tax=Streptomyces endophyticus TaxID=714166 RepID=A0ABU6FD47_9ACTN|nr:DUF2207 domain-containing protein [Streptomyces endophyticus]MEB8341894.1 DUF2207 domain-containing protein [Streptomyces endophyticus]